MRAVVAAAARRYPVMAEFLRGTLVAQTRDHTALDYGYDKPTHGLLHVDAGGGQRVVLLDELLRLTEYLRLQDGATYAYVISPYWATDPQYYPLDGLPPAVGRFDEHVWWEQPLWWGGIVRDLHWQCPIDWHVLASSLEPTREWWLLETPAGQILYDPSHHSARWPRGEVGALITWEDVRWFKLHAILP
jgi:hypothetical protein